MLCPLRAGSASRKPYARRADRARLKGERANLSAVAEDLASTWEQITPANCYAAKERCRGGALREDGLLEHGALPAVPLRWVFIRDPRAEFKSQALLFAPISMRSPSASSRGSSDPLADGGYFSRGAASPGLCETQRQ